MSKTTWAITTINRKIREPTTIRLKIYQILLKLCFIILIKLIRTFKNYSLQSWKIKSYIVFYIPWENNKAWVGQIGQTLTLLLIPRIKMNKILRKWQGWSREFLCGCISIQKAVCGVSTDVAVPAVNVTETEELGCLWLRTSWCISALDKQWVTVGSATWAWDESVRECAWGQMR